MPRGVVDASVQPFGVLFPDPCRCTPHRSMPCVTAAVRALWLGWSQALGREANKTPRSAANAVVDVFAAADHPDADLRACLVTAARGLFRAEPKTG
jgi:hypothetical protein